MKRRLFLKSSASSLIAAPALAQAQGKQAFTNATDRIFYDARFRDAATFASRLSHAGAEALTPVNGDITAPWVAELQTLSRRRSLVLRGVTTESFYFCLKTLLQSRGLAHAHIERVARDLHAWEIRTNIMQQHGMA